MSATPPASHTATKARRQSSVTRSRWPPCSRARNAKVIIVACNTVSSVAIPKLRAHVSVPVVGVIEPGRAGRHRHDPKSPCRRHRDARDDSERRLRERAIMRSNVHVRVIGLRLSPFGAADRGRLARRSTDRSSHRAISQSDDYGWHRHARARLHALPTSGRAPSAARSATSQAGRFGAELRRRRAQLLDRQIAARSATSTPVNCASR